MDSPKAKPRRLTVGQVHSRDQPGDGLMQPASNTGLFHATAGGSEVLKRSAVASAGASPEQLILPPGSLCPC